MPNFKSKIVNKKFSVWSRRWSFIKYIEVCMIHCSVLLINTNCPNLGCQSSLSVWRMTTGDEVGAYSWSLLGMCVIHLLGPLARNQVCITDCPITCRGPLVTGNKGSCLTHVTCQESGELKTTITGLSDAHRAVTDRGKLLDFQGNFLIS